MSIHNNNSDIAIGCTEKEHKNLEYNYILLQSKFEIEKELTRQFKEQGLEFHSDSIIPHSEKRIY